MWNRAVSSGAKTASIDLVTAFKLCDDPEQVFKIEIELEEAAAAAESGNGAGGVKEGDVVEGQDVGGGD